MTPKALKARMKRIALGLFRITVVGGIISLGVIAAGALTVAIGTYGWPLAGPLLAALVLFTAYKLGGD